MIVRSTDPTCKGRAVRCCEMYEYVVLVVIQVQGEATVGYIGQILMVGVLQRISVEYA